MTVKRALKVLAVSTILAGGVFYALFIHRYEMRVSHDGWVFEMRYLAMACRHCTGIITRFECNGVPITPPTLKRDGDSLEHLLLYTPVGDFQRASGIDRWFYNGPPLPIEHSTDAITADELKRRFYEVSDDQRCKRGTPPHWCRAMSYTGKTRWLDPALIPTLDW